jgi:hypothetical protein
LRVGAQEVPHLVALRHAGHGQQVLQVLVQVGAPLQDEAAVQVGAQVALGGQLQLVLGELLQAPVERLKVAVPAEGFVLQNQGTFEVIEVPLSNRGAITNRPGNGCCEGVLFWFVKGDACSWAECENS